MRNAIILAAATILTFSATAFADVKIKTKQTMSGQSTEHVTYIKGKRQRTEMSSGAYSMISVTQCDLRRDLQLNPGAKTYMVNPYDDGQEPSTTTPDASGKTAPIVKGGTIYVTTTTKDTGERKQMFGYTARRIIQTIETESGPDACSTTKSKMEMDMWVVDAEFGLSCPQNRTYRSYNGKDGGCKDKYVPKTIGTAKTGYPLWQKMTSYDANGKESFSTIQEVVELSKATLDQALFEVPADYREVKDSAQLYAQSASTTMSSRSSSSSSSPSDMSYGSTSSAPSSGMTSSIAKANTSAAPQATSTQLEAKKPGTVRIGVAVKTTSVGEGITANDLTAAVQNTLGAFLKGTNVEIVPLEARLASALAGEAKEKQCDFVLTASAAHKKGGGGGFGFGKMLGNVVSQTGLGHTGSVAGNIAASVAHNAIITATSVAGNVKSKDELTLDLKLQSTADNSSPLAKQFKAKAKSDGDDIISTVVEQAAQAILDAVGKG